MVQKEPGNISETAEEESINFNVGGWHFSIPRSKVAQFPESLLWKEASVQDQSENLRLFVDQDGFIFRHLHYYLQTSKLSFSNCAELNLLYEQALILQLTPLLQTLDNLNEGKHNLRVRHADIPIAERASLNYWRTQKCISKPSEIPLKSPAFTGLQERAPLGLMDTPLLDTEEEVNYCFLPLDLVEKYPVLINDDNLLWLLENAALIECDCSEFRFIVNFLRSEEILLPDDFSNIDVLEEEVVILGIPKLTDAVKIYRGNIMNITCEGSAEGSESKPQVAEVPVRAPLYVMALGVLVKYPDSALGQLYVGSNLDRNKLYISGNGVLFQHVKNWLGTSRLPLTENMSEIQELCAYLDKRDITYQPMKDALKCFLKQQVPAESRDYNADWTAEVSVCSLRQIVKVYVGSSWYETYLQTLLKYPELLSNDKKVYWITYGQSLLIHGDGQMFRHVLNFLRLGKLFLPSEFKEWPLFCQEAEEYQIPSLLEALYHCDAYRLWIKKHEFHNEASFPCRGLSIVTWNKEHQFSRDSEEEYSYTAVDFSKCYINTWSKIKDLKGKQDTNGEKAKYSRMISRPRGAKRRSKLGGFHKSSDSQVNCSYYKHSVSPPRKRGIRSGLPQKLENKDSATPIQKLISLVKEWDMVNSKRCGFQHVTVSDGNITDHVSQNNTPEKHSGMKGSLASSPGKISYAIEKNNSIMKYEAGAEEKWLCSYMFKQNLSVTPCSGKYQFSTTKTTHTMGKTAENRNWEQAEGSFSSEVRDKHLQMKLIPVKSKTMDNEQTNIVLEEHRHVGLILKVEHPPVLGSDGFCTCNEESVVYSILLDDSQLDNSYTQVLAKDAVFLSFALSHEEIFYARKCHCFLTDVILTSVKQKDPKEITAKVMTLVNRLWTLQITPKDFVADLLNTEYFKGDRHVHEELLKWVEFTLPFAWKYSRCIDLVIQRGFARSVSYFALKM
ncbi:BTB/POZ domain-containing protein KCTD19 [Rhea pennata]|uniref:BTB/POZ domain-containing protein KCTD19 n=1 Tax=Rhea pennata TaxID=8795 RepID=UPI002E269512